VSDLPFKMQQWWVVPGAGGGLLECRTVDTPTIASNDVLVEVHAAGINRGELIGRAAMRSDAPGQKPRRSGIEFSGRVVGVGDGVDSWSVGDRVMGRGGACHAQFVTAGASACMPSPGHLSEAQAGSIPNVFVTAHDAMVSAAGVKAGESVLITAGSSGVGTAAIQTARYLGAAQIVATTRSPHKAAELRSLGATHVVDTGRSLWLDEIASIGDGMDVVIDQVGGELFPQLIRTLRVKGRYVTVGRNAGAQSTIDLDLVARNRLLLAGVTFRTRTPGEALACSQKFAADLLGAFDPDANGDVQLWPVLDRTFSMSELPEAHDYMLSNQQIGKIVLLPHR
jgi:NADPH:quinone reductase